MLFVDQYLAGRFLRIYLVALLLFFLLLLALSLNRDLITFVSRGLILPTEFLGLVFYPSLQFAVPSMLFAFAISVSLYASDVRRNQNHVVLFTSGRSSIRIALPMIVLAAMMSVGIAAYNVLFIHRAYSGFFDILIDLKERSARQVIAEKQFLTIEGHVFYARNSDADKGEYSGFIMANESISRDQNNNHQVAIASVARIRQQDGRNFVDLRDGTLFIFSDGDRDRVQKITFLDLHPDTEDRITINYERDTRAYRQPLKLLAKRIFSAQQNASKGASKNTSKDDRHYFHQRLSEPLYPLGLSAFFVMLVGRTGKKSYLRDRLMNLGLSALAIGTILIQVAGINSIGSENELVFAAYLAPGLGWIALLISHLYRKARSERA